MFGCYDILLTDFFKKIFRFDREKQQSFDFTENVLFYLQNNNNNNKARVYERLVLLFQMSTLISTLGFAVRYVRKDGVRAK